MRRIVVALALVAVLAVGLGASSASAQYPGYGFPGYGYSGFGSPYSYGYGYPGYGSVGSPYGYPTSGYSAYSTAGIVPGLTSYSGLSFNNPGGTLGYGGGYSNLGPCTPVALPGGGIGC